MDGAAPGDLYDRDFYAWTQDQAARLRALGPRNDGVDVEHVAEEIESLGRSDRRAAESLLGLLLLHLMKLRAEPGALPRRHWEAEIDGFRDRLERIFRDSPSLHARRAELAGDEWQALRRRARRAIGRGDPTPTDGAIAAAPVLPFDLDAEVLNEAWFPPA